MNFAAMRYLTEGGCPVDGAAWQLLAVIAWHADKRTGEAYVSRRTLAVEARLSTGSVHTVLIDLLDRGVLEVVVAGDRRRAMTYRICIPSDSASEPRPDPTSDSASEPRVAQSGARGGSIHRPGVAQLASRPIGMKVEPEGKSLKGQSATAASVDDDPTADAVVVHSAEGNGLPPDITAALQAIKDKLRVDLQADRQAQAARERDLLGPPATEATG